MPSIAIGLPEEMVQEAEKCATLNMRSVPEQIEYWYRLGKAAEENPDLPIEFIKGILEGKADIEAGRVTPFKFGFEDNSMQETASLLLSPEESLALTKRLENPKKPNKTLIKAMKEYKKTFPE